MPEQKDVEPKNPTTSEKGKATKPSSALGGVARVLTDNELSSAGARKLLIDRLDTAEKQIEDLKSYKDNFHEVDKMNSVLNERLRTYRSFEVLYSVSLSLGSILLGVSPKIWDNKPYGYIVLVIGIILVSGAIVAKALRK